jgi:hypothetical protein
VLPAAINPDLDEDGRSLLNKTDLRELARHLEKHLPEEF